MTGVRCGFKSSAALVAVVTVTVLTVVSATQPPRMLMFGTMAIGPALAAATAVPTVVLLIGGYAFAAAFGVSTWQGLLGAADQMLRLAMIVAVTAIAWGLARHQQLLQRAWVSAVREREMLAAVAEQSADAVIASTLDGVILTWNGG